MRIYESLDPDAYGVCDSAEYLIGLAFVLCQRYITSTIGSEIDKTMALALPPTHSNGKAIAQIVNVAANAWKHSDEWPFGERTSVAQRTIDVIESVTPYKEYVACNLFHCLTGSSGLLDEIAANVGSVA